MTKYIKYYETKFYIFPWFKINNVKFLSSQERAKKLELEGLEVAKDDAKMEFNWEMLKGLFNNLYIQSFHVADGDDVPSHIDLIDMDTNSKMNLKSLSKSNVPLVLNFGSCT